MNDMMWHCEAEASSEHAQAEGKVMGTEDNFSIVASALYLLLLLAGVCGLIIAPVRLVWWLAGFTTTKRRKPIGFDVIIRKP